METIVLYLREGSLSARQNLSGQSINHLHLFKTRFYAANTPSSFVVPFIMRQKSDRRRLGEKTPTYRKTQLAVSTLVGRRLLLTRAQVSSFAIISTFLE